MSVPNTATITSAELPERAGESAGAPRELVVAEALGARD
jgi:hypothetical protein